MPSDKPSDKPYEKDPAEIGTLWIHTGPKGEYLKGEVGGVKVVAFRNLRKTKETQPDWRILKSLPPSERPPAPPPPDEDW